MDDKAATGPNDDELYGHGGVDVPTDHLQDLPPVKDDAAKSVDEAAAAPDGDTGGPPA